MILNRSKQFWVGLMLVLSLALLVRGLFFYRTLTVSGAEGFYAKENQDAGEYISLARNFFTGKFTQGKATNFLPEQFRTPGYPLFLSLVSWGGRNLLAAILAQNILFLAFIGLFFRYLEKKAGLALAIISSLILALDPTIIYWNNQITSETLFTIVLGLSVFFLLRFAEDGQMRSLVWSAIWLLVSVYVRPISLYLPVVWSILLLLIGWSRKFTWRKTAVLFILLWAIWFGGTVPWRWRNYQISHTPIFSTSTAIGFGKYLTAMALARHEPVPTLATNDPLKQITYQKAETIRYIKNYPLLFLKIHLTSLAPFLIGDGYQNSLQAVVPGLKDKIEVTDWNGKPSQLFDFLMRNIRSGNVLFIFGKLIWGGLVVTALLGAIVWLADPRFRIPAMIILLVIYYFALASGVGSYSRFRYPVNPEILILFAAGLGTIIKKCTRHHERIT